VPAVRQVADSVIRNIASPIADWTDVCGRGPCRLANVGREKRMLISGGSSSMRDSGNVGVLDDVAVGDRGGLVDGVG
jgi:hypothetical protein